MFTVQYCALMLSLSDYNRIAKCFVGHLHNTHTISGYIYGKCEGFVDVKRSSGKKLECCPTPTEVVSGNLYIFL